MVDLPPPIDELNEYGRFAFLNEMFSMASFIMNHISDQEKNSYLKFALSAIEAERTNLRDLFKNPYQRPEAENVLALILRCAELYLQEGQWYNLCNAELQLIEKDKIKIKVKGYDHQLVDQSAEKIIQTAQRSGARISGPIPLPTEKQVVTVLRSTHINKDSREQFETRTHKRLIYVLRPSNKSVEALMGLDISSGVDIEIKL